MSESETPVLASEVTPEPSAPTLEFEPFKLKTTLIDSEEKRIKALSKLEVGRYHRVPIGLVKLAKKNPRRGAVSEAIESLREFGQHRAAVVQQSRGEVVVGNHMLKGMLALGWHELDIFLVDDDDKTALRRAITDNATGDKAAWDEAELAEVMDEIGPVPGFTEDDVAKLLEKLTPEADKAEPTYPLVARLNEHYDYVIVFCETETDWLWLQTRLDLRHEKSYKSSEVYFSHVLTVSRLQEALGEKPAAPTVTNE